MILKGRVVDIKSYDTTIGRVANIYIREDSPNSVTFHAALWRDQAETIESTIRVSDNITVSAYASKIVNRQVDLSDFDLLEVKRPVSYEQETILSKQVEETMRGEISDD